MELHLIFGKLGISLGLGLLVGLQRERVDSPLAGVRTFPLVTVLGTLCGLLAAPFGGFVVAAGFIGLAGLLVAGNLIQLKAQELDPGLTTEVALLLMFGVGAYLAVGHTEVAIALGGGTAILLYLKEQLHGFAGRLGEQDVKAIMQFALVSMVILPVLPNRAFGPYQVLNPRQIWLMVVLIVGISLGGYVAYKLVGERAGSILGGVIGGVISSTATTVTYARRSAHAAGSSGLAALVIMISSTVVFARVLLEVAVVAPNSVAAMAPPIVALMLVLAGLSIALWLEARRTHQAVFPQHGNPSELKTAVVFGALYAAMLLAVAATKEHFGDLGLYMVALLSGLTDMDAITLSTSQLVNAGRLTAETGWRAIILASLSNLVFKAVTVAFLGRRRLVIRIAVLYGLALLAGLLIVLLWPFPAGD